MTVVDPIRDENGWAFRDPSGKIPLGAPFESTDPVNGFQFLSEAYKATDPGFDERVTVPVLWDTKTKRIVNNCEDDICRMFNDVFNDFARNKDVVKHAADIILRIVHHFFGLFVPQNRHGNPGAVIRIGRFIGFAQEMEAVDRIG